MISAAVSPPQDALWTDGAWLIKLKRSHKTQSVLTNILSWVENRRGQCNTDWQEKQLVHLNLAVKLSGPHTQLKIKKNNVDIH